MSDAYQWRYAAHRIILQRGEMPLGDLWYTREGDPSNVWTWHLWGTDTSGDEVDLEAAKAALLGAAMAGEETT